MSCNYTVVGFFCAWCGRLHFRLTKCNFFNSFINENIFKGLLSKYCSTVHKHEY
jgi:hypothetical protein